MTEHPIRPFTDDAAVRRVGEGLLARTLPREDWTHEAHLAACLWLLTERPDIVPERELPAIIRGYNESVGTANTDSSGYHETLTQLYIRGERLFLECCEETALVKRVNALLASPIGRRDWPLRFYSRDLLFSVAARRGWVEPDVCLILL
jgi:hypothetical protein